MNQPMISEALFAEKTALPGWNETERLKAWEMWQKMAIPSSRDEAWKYTSLSRLEKISFAKACPTDFELNLKSIPLPFSKNRFCFVDGEFKAHLSTPLTSDTYLLSRGPWPQINKETQMPFSYFERLNAALVDEGLYLDITADSVDPIYLIFWYGDRDTPTSHHLRHHIKVHPGVKSHLVIVDGDNNHSTHLATQMIEIELAEGASLYCTHIKKPANTGHHILHTYAHLAENSQLKHFNFDFGAKLSRNEITVCLKGDASQCQLNGLAIARGLDHIDNQTRINHLAPKTHSLEQYRGIIDDKACHVFHGHVFVDANASDSIANQHNKNILLTATGQAYTEPQLEIYNQNVQCVHGATVGDLDENALFYLQSRGLDEKQARQLLIFGFARSILDTLDNPSLQTELERWIKTHLALDNTLISDLYRDTSS